MDDTDYMLTTTDNPYDPFTQWDAWWQYDTGNGYNTSQLIARIAKVSHDLSDTDQELAIKQAIDEIVEVNASGVYKKAFRKQN